MGLSFSDTTKVGTLTDEASISWDAGAIQVATVTLGGNRTLAAPTDIKDGGTYLLIVNQDGTGTRTLAYNSVFKWKGGTAPTLSTGIDEVDVLTFICHNTAAAGLVLYGVEALNFS